MSHWYWCDMCPLWYHYECLPYDQQLLVDLSTITNGEIYMFLLYMFTRTWGVNGEMPKQSPNTVHSFHYSWFHQTVLCQNFSIRSNITKTRLFKYIKNFSTKNWKFSDKYSDIFHISAQNMDWRYALELPCWSGSNEYPQSMFLSRNNTNNVYLCKPQVCHIKMGFKGVKII